MSVFPHIFRLPLYRFHLKIARSPLYLQVIDAALRKMALSRSPVCTTVEDGAGGKVGSKPKRLLMHGSISEKRKTLKASKK
jgi:hypothetical protein